MTTADTVTAVRQRLGRVGVWFGALRTAGADAGRYTAQRVEELGYGSLWTGERLGGKEPFAESAVLMAATSKIVTGIGIANIWTRHPSVMQQGAATLNAAWPGRFVLAVGVGNAETVNSSGLTYDKPLDHMSRYLAGMDAASGGGPVCERPLPRLVGALRPKMLEVARDQADGVHTFFVPASHTPLARAVLGPDRLVIPEQAVVLATDATEARGIAREHVDFYLRLPNLRNNLRALGYSDDDFETGGSDRLVDALVAWGDETAITRRIHEHLDAGADHVLLQPLGDLGTTVDELDRLAPALLPG
ncbi:TIGR03620 family F420-dependent LLM class oxidoreductase [Streptomyces sp. MI02-2A]|uniref:TIGR03620 family F420-dependent LLM class oxidoreductase n=1 Tax=unclassified Streptomyces TaxID=2593676 RepID=UPI000E27F9C1|nr:MULTISPECIES: TIGR03620 family F420-dependent LLM class oxidoreductase [unclassified Streptomyces]MDX3265865.1 TIGR03620 family F420-dependent LLM class oxidoreductase [Streptomyces sp. MI02-2A]REE64001.1 putative F420-dependent oxidoreductase [Streptomyces sp. 3212.3]